MSDFKDEKASLQKRFEQVSPDMLTKFFESKNIHMATCPICSSNDIGTPSTKKDRATEGFDDTRLYITPVRIDTEGPPYSLVHYEYRLICKNCAHTMRFAVWPILSWVEKEKGLDNGF